MADDISLHQLQNAVQNNNLQFIQNWLNICDTSRRKIPHNSHYLLLLLALNSNHRNIARLLINSGCPLKSKIGNVEKLIQKTVRNDDIETTTMLLAKKDDNEVSGNDCVSSALSIAATETRSLNMVKLLLRNNANVNYIGCEGMTVLQLLFENIFRNDAVTQINDDNVNDIVQSLLLHGASINFRSLNGQTALHYAVRLGNRDVLHTVLQNIDNVNAISLLNETPLHIFLSNNANAEKDIIDTLNLFLLKGARGDIPNYQNETACHIAARRKYIKVLQNLLMQCQCDINFYDIECCSVLHRILEDSLAIDEREDYINLVNWMILQEPFCNIKNHHGKTPLHIATENKQYEILLNMLFRVENLNIPDYDGDTILHIFLRDQDENSNFEDSINVISKLLEQGANVDLANKIRQTPMHLAIELNNIKLLCLVLKFSNDLNNIYPTLGWSILHILSSDRWFTRISDIEMTEVAEMCIKKGATVDLKDLSSWTPLCLAVANKKLALVKVLLQYGANVNARTKQYKAMMHNLFLINSDVDVEIAEILLAHGMEIDRAFHSIELKDFENKEGLLTTLVTHMKDVTKYNVLGKTLLHSVLQNNAFTNIVVEQRLAKFVSMVLSKGAPVDTKNYEQKTALHFAVENKHNSVTKVLLEHGADAKSLSAKDNSALHLISKQSTDTGVEEEIIDAIVAKGCLINARNSCGFTPFLLAAQSGSAACLNALKKHNANVHCTVGEHSDSALHLAASANNARNIIKPIVQCGVDVNYQRKDGKTALHFAAASAQIEATKALCESAADPNMKDNEGRTALHIACWNNSLDNVTCLLEYGADVNATDNYQTVPLMLAQSSDTMIQEKLIYHIKKLDLLKMYVSPLNRELVAKTAIPLDILSLEVSINNEMCSMSEICIEEKIVLSDVLQMKSRRLYALKNNRRFQHLINTACLNFKFPHLADLIKAHYRKGLIRSHFLFAATKSLKKMLGLELPEICCKKIFMYLSNENLQKLVTAARLTLRKRKRPSKVVVVKKPRCVYM